MSFLLWALVGWLIDNAMWDDSILDGALLWWVVWSLLDSDNESKERHRCDDCGYRLDKDLYCNNCYTQYRVKKT